MYKKSVSLIIKGSIRERKNNKTNSTNLVIIIMASFAIILSLFNFIRVSSFVKTRAEENVVEVFNK